MRYSFKLNWIDYLADTESMKHKQTGSISFIITRLDCCCQINHKKINIPNAQHVTTKIDRLVILILLDNHYSLRAYNKHLDLNLELTYRILIG